MDVEDRDASQRAPNGGFADSRMSVTNRAGHQARTGRDDSHAQNSSGTTCDGCDQRDADGINVDGRSLCRPCARRAETLVDDGGEPGDDGVGDAFARATNVSRVNARDEWRAAELAAEGVMSTATTALAVARQRVNHAAAEGVQYQ